MSKKLHTHRHPEADEELDHQTIDKRSWPVMLLLAGGVVAMICTGVYFDLDTRVLAGLAVLVGLVSGLFVWLLGIIGLVPLIGPIIVKVLSLSFIWLLNAIGYLVSYIAIRRGYSRDVLTYRGLTIALLIGIVIGYIVAQFI